MQNMIHKANASDVNDSSAVLQAGQLCYINGAFYRYVLNNEASTAGAANNVYVYDTTNMGSCKLSAAGDAAKGHFAGVGIGAITAQRYGLIQVGGKEATCDVSGTVAVGDGLTISGTAKKLRAIADVGASQPERLCAIALEAGTDAAVKVMIVGRI